MRLHKCSKLCGLGASVFALTTAAAAQVDSKGAALEEIVVTAQKRVSTVQETPLAVTAITGDDLAQRNITSAKDLSGLAPNLNVSGSSSEVVISIRGVSSAGITPARDPSVAFHVDGVYMPRPTGANAMFYDLERVEVLRGPQGTLWGRNATAGSLNVISRKPSDKLESAAEVSVGNLNYRSFQGMLNAPVVADTFALRGAFITTDRDGYSKNRNAEMPDLDDIAESAGRLHALITPGENLRILLSGDYYQRAGAGTGDVVIGNRNTSFLESGAAEPWIVNTNTAAKTDNRAYGFSAEITWSLGAVDLVSLSSYRYDNIDVFSDADSNPTGTGFIHFFNDNTTFTQELRVASRGEGPLEWILGAYYLDEKNNDSLDFFSNAGRTIGQMLRRPKRFAESWAAFGQASWHLSDEFRLLVGGRYSEDTKGSPSGLTRVFGNPAVPNTVNVFAPDAGEWSEPTWKVGFDWSFTDDNLLYANVGTGYKAGGFSSNTNYDAESVLAYELGLKNRLLDKAALLNIAVFYYDYEDLQVVATVPDNSGTLRARTTNAAGSTVWGVEAELQYRVTDHFRLMGAAAYLDATFDEYPTASDSIFRTTQNLSGYRLPRAPEQALRLSASYEWPLSSGALTARADLTYQSEVFLTEFNDVAYATPAGVIVNPYRMAMQDDYTKSGFTLRYESDAGNWYAEAFIDNIEDEAVMNSAAFGATNDITANYTEPRTYGVKMGVKL